MRKLFTHTLLSLAIVMAMPAVAEELPLAPQNLEVDQTLSTFVQESSTAASTPAAATAIPQETVKTITINGMDESADAALISNIRSSLTLTRVIGTPQGQARMGFLLNQAQTQAREALEPFGYYSPTITVETPRDGNAINVIITVDKGEPVQVREYQVAISGLGEKDRYLNNDLSLFRPQQGDVFVHSIYENSKTTINRRLRERGYFDADTTQQRVEITRAQKAADIFLTWDTGRRYDMGPTTFHQDYFRPDLFDRLVYWEEGSYFHQGKLDRLRESLQKLDYFSVIDIAFDPEKADDWRVPVDINLMLARRSIYTYGLSYGTESGAGVRVGLDRRYVNDRGHKLGGEINWAQNRKLFNTYYRIPAFGWLDGWYMASITATDEQTNFIDLRNARLSFSRSGQINRNLIVIASVNLLRERWRYGEQDENNRNIYQFSTLLYPELRADYVRVDDRMFPRRGFGANVGLRGGLESVGSDANFIQLFGTFRTYFPIGEANRIILRAEGGTSYSNDLLSLPPSLRFFAGGDRSIRGYAWREVGPRTPDPDNYALGAKHVVTSTAEYEHYFGGGPWGAAVFVDSGSAFDRKIDLHTGVGIGFRWRSPVGPVRVDIARGLNNPDSAFQLYLNIGADL